MPALCCKKYQNLIRAAICFAAARIWGLNRSLKPFNIFVWSQILIGVFPALGNMISSSHVDSIGD